VDGDVGALGGEAEGYETSNAFGGAGDEGDAAESLFSSGMDRSHNSTGKGSTTPAKITTVSR